MSKLKKGLLITGGMCGLAFVFYTLLGNSKSDMWQPAPRLPAVTEAHAEPTQGAESVSNASVFPNASAPTAPVTSLVAGATQGSGSGATVSGASHPSKVTNPDGSTTCYIDGPDGRYLSATTYDAAGQLKFTDRFTYDSQGNKLGVQRQRPDGFVAVKQMTYDASGNELKTRIINKDGNSGTEEEWNR